MVNEREKTAAPATPPVFSASYRRALVVRLAAAILPVVGCLAAGLYLYLNRPFQGDYLVAMTQLERLRAAVRWSVLATVTLQVGIFALLVGLATVFWTHKVAGPLYRLCQVLRRLAAGDRRPMARVRRDDQLQEIPALLNRGLETLTAATAAVQDRLARLEAESERLAAAVAAGRETDPAGRLDHLRRQLHQVLADRFWGDDG